MEEKSVVQILTEARALIERPENWCQHLRVNDSGARCALGALDGVTHIMNPEWGRAVERLEVLLTPAERTISHAVLRDFGLFAPFSASSTVAQFNNTHAHAEVLDLFDRAIAAERAKQQGSHLTEQVQSIIDDALEAATKVVEPVE